MLRVVTIYPDKNATKLPDANAQRSSMMHETGHSWSYQQWGTDEKKGKWIDWQKAMDADGTSVSAYAKSAIAEDVAETVKIYGSTFGTPRFDEYRKIVPKRFEILDKEYKEKVGSKAPDPMGKGNQAKGGGGSWI